MGAGERSGGERLGARTQESGGRLRTLISGAATYARPLLMLALALPIMGYAVAYSVSLIGTPFPGFFVMENRVVPTVSGLSWPPDKAAVFHSQVVAADGRAVESSAGVSRIAAGRPVGTPVAWTFRRGGEPVHVTMPTLAFDLTDYLQTYGILLLFGTTNLVIGFVVGFLQPRTRQARVFLLHTFAAGMYPTTAVFLHHPEFHWLNKLCLVMEAFTPATFVHLALVFPVARRFVGRARLIPALPYLVSAALLGLVFDGFYREPPVLAALHLVYLYFAAALGGLLASMAWAFRTHRDPTTRSLIKAVLPGAALATTVQLVIFTNNALSGRNLPVQFGLLTPIPYYLSIAYAIARHDLFDIDRIVRQSFVCGVLSVVVVGVYAVTLLVASRWFPGLGEQREALLGLVCVLGLALGLDPLRQAVQRGIDRAFYRTRLDYQATIGQLSEVMTTLLDLYEVVAQVTQVVTDAMQLESTSLYLREASGGGVVWSRRADQSALRQAAAAELEPVMDICERFPREFAAERIVAHLAEPSQREAVRTLLAPAGVRIVVPLLFRHSAVGLLALGSKRSGRSFTSDDIDLLRTLANQTAIAVQNARSYQGLATITKELDAKVRERTEELRLSHAELSEAYEQLKNAQAQLVQSEKLAAVGQLVAGVAHEINNPASFVHGSLANLEEYFTRLQAVLQAYERAPLPPAAAHDVDVVRRQVRLDYVRAQMPELLRICSEGSERIKNIVDNLRTFARAERGARVPTRHC
jgi:GAF domain-containing protein